MADYVCDVKQRSYILRITNSGIRQHVLSLKKTNIFPLANLNYKHDEMKLKSICMKETLVIHGRMSIIILIYSNT